MRTEDYAKFSTWLTDGMRAQKVETDLIQSQKPQVSTLSAWHAFINNIIGARARFMTDERKSEKEIMREFWGIAATRYAEEGKQ